MRRDLAEKRALIAEALPEDGRAEAGEVGGLFLAPRMTAWLGRSVDGVKLTPENLPRIVYEHTHVVLNGGAWCGRPGARARGVLDSAGEAGEGPRPVAGLRSAAALTERCGFKEGSCCRGGALQTCPTVGQVSEARMRREHPDRAVLNLSDRFLRPE